MKGWFWSYNCCNWYSNFSTKYLITFSNGIKCLIYKMWPENLIYDYSYIKFSGWEIILIVDFNYTFFVMSFSSQLYFLIIHFHFCNMSIARRNGNVITFKRKPGALDEYSLRIWQIYYHERICAWIPYPNVNGWWYVIYTHIYTPKKIHGIDIIVKWVCST